MRRLLGVLVMLLAAGALAVTASASGWPPWTTITSGGGQPVPGGGDAAGVVIGSLAALDRYEAVALVPGHRQCCDWKQAFDWKRDAVLLVVARNQDGFPKLVSLARQGATLHVAIAAPAANSTVVAYPLFTAMRVSRHLLGSPLPRRIVVAQAPSVR